MLAGLALTPVLASTLACGTQDQPEPKKVEQQQPFDRGDPRPENDPNDLLRNPATETPRGRDGEQIPDAEIDAVLADAAKFAETGNVTRERNALRKCANKTPASARCDGRMGLSLIGGKNRRATALYYLVSAATVDDPKADAALYMSIGEELRRFGKTQAAIAALEKAVARDASAENLHSLGRALSLQPATLGEAADRIAEARGKHDSIDWLYEEAVLRGQIPVREQAEQSLALFKDYMARAKALAPESLPAPTDAIATRVAELDQLRKNYPSAAEYEKAQRAKDDKAKPSPAPAKGKDAKPSPAAAKGKDAEPT